MFGGFGRSGDPVVHRFERELESGHAGHLDRRDVHLHGDGDEQGRADGDGAHLLHGDRAGVCGGSVDFDATVGSDGDGAGGGDVHGGWLDAG